MPIKITDKDKDKEDKENKEDIAAYKRLRTEAELAASEPDIILTKVKAATLKN